MPQDGANNYQYPPGTPGIPDQTIESEAYNTFLDDLVTNDLNIPRPVHRGGTGGSTANKALINLASEKATQLVTNYDAHVWLPGSFRSSNATGQGAPVDGHAFAGICYLNESYVDPPTNENVVVEARDLDGDASLGSLYVRHKDEGVWGDWVQQVAGPTRNRIVNGAMQISQEHGYAAGITDGFYMADQWSASFVTDGGLSFVRSAAATPNGSKDRINIYVTVADASIAANQFCCFYQMIEGNRIADFRWGSASARQVILRFGWYSPAGTYSVAIQNQDSTRAYVANFTISAGQANTDTEQTIIIPGETTGTWITDDSKGMLLIFTIAAGSNHQDTADTWITGNILGTVSNTNGIATVANLFGLFDVGLYIDIDSTGVPPRWEMPDPIQELLTCSRYYSISRFILSTTPNIATGFFFAPMRATPTIICVPDAGTGAVVAPTGGTPAVSYYQATAHSAGTGATIIGNARM